MNKGDAMALNLCLELTALKGKRGNPQIRFWIQDLPQELPKPQDHSPDKKTSVALSEEDERRVDKRDFLFLV